MIQGFKDRFSFVSFAVPTEGTVIQAPQKLVDQQYPRAFKDFDSMNFIRFSYSEEARGLDSDKQVYAYAGIWLNTRPAPPKTRWHLVHYLSRTCLFTRSCVLVYESEGMQIWIMVSFRIDTSWFALWSTSFLVWGPCKLTVQKKRRPTCV